MAEPSADWSPIDRRSTSDTVADELRRRIVDGSLPPGAQLGEVAIASGLGVSRGPVREALQRLVQEGLAVAERHRGVFVATLDDQDVADVYVARAAVERAAAAEVVRRGDLAAVDHLRGLVAQMRTAAGRGERDRLADLDLDFHEALVAASGSRRLARMYDTLVAETRMSMGRLRDDYPEPDALVAEHEALTQALGLGELEEVLAIVDTHLQHATRRPRTQEA